MRSMVVMLAAVLVLTGGGLAYGQDCVCHGVPMSHPVLAGSPIRILSATVMVKTSAGETTYTMNPEGVVRLPLVSQKDLVSITVTISAIDPDDDVCEADDGDVNARLKRTNMDIGGMVARGSGTWTRTWKPEVGTHVVGISGRVEDGSADHPDSDDTDLRLNNKYKFRLRVTKK